MRNYVATHNLLLSGNIQRNPGLLYAKPLPTIDANGRVLQGFYMYYLLRKHFMQNLSV